MSWDLVIDLQFGSTGKGLICGYLSEFERYDTVVAAWGPNAGHTYVNSKGEKIVVTMLPIAAHNGWCRAVCLGPGAVIDVEALAKEITFAIEKCGASFSLYIHPQAVILKASHSAAEKQGTNIKIGSTMKGTGAAVIDKIVRDTQNSPLVRDISFDDKFKISRLVDLDTSEGGYDRAIDSARRGLIEGAQGFSLGIHRRFWPYVTSREVTPSQVMADCAIPMRIARRVSVVGTMRTFPIRVANRYDADGNMVGTSGPVYPDQRELTWEEFGMTPELTTVTKLPRRIFTFSEQQTREAVRMCAPNHVFLNFCNYGNDAVIDECVHIIASSGATVSYLGFGPAHKDVVEA